MRDIGPLIDHMRQSLGPGVLDLLIYNLVAEMKAAPIRLNGEQKDTELAPGFSREYSSVRGFVCGRYKKPSVPTKAFLVSY